MANLNLSQLRLNPHKLFRATCVKADVTFYWYRHFFGGTEYHLERFFEAVVIDHSGIQPFKNRTRNKTWLDKNTRHSICWVPFFSVEVFRSKSFGVKVPRLPENAIQIVSKQILGKIPNFVYCRHTYFRATVGMKALPT